MSDIAIQIDHLGKRYRIGERKRFKTLRDTLTETVLSPLRSNSSKSIDDEWIWALRNASFEIKYGEVVGIIGPNGAGKSTLLKILSRITEPTEGKAEIHGRVGSLLEVGTGFHPELTGRENIFLNGAILGMKKTEIARKFDEIVAFAEVAQFIDTPVKHYSSGMYVRLAFAVAAHLEPEILLVDEVLAVGDAAFQRKCLGKMGDVAKEGRTVLFVSHNMGAIVQLCPLSVLLKSGKIETIDRSDVVVGKYLSEDTAETTDVHINPNVNLRSQMILTRCWLANSEGDLIKSVDVTKEFAIGLQVMIRRPVSDADMSVRFHNALGQPLFTTNLSDSDNAALLRVPGECVFLIHLPNRFLAPGGYFLHIGLHRPNVEMLDTHDHILSFQVEESGSNMWQYHGKEYGNILVQFPWECLKS